MAKVLLLDSPDILAASMKNRFQAPLPIRLLATALATAVMLLSLVAASPEAHEWLCHHHKAPAGTHTDLDESCVVAAFGHGQVNSWEGSYDTFLGTAKFSGETVVLETQHIRCVVAELPRSCGPPSGFQA